MVAAIRRAFFGNTPVVAASGPTGPRAPAENSAESDMGADGKRESCLARSDAHGTLSGKSDTPRSPRLGVVAQNRRVHPRATGISRPPHRGATPTRPRHCARAKEGERRAHRYTTPAETRFSQKSFPDFIFRKEGTLAPPISCLTAPGVSGPPPLPTPAPACCCASATGRTRSAGTNFTPSTARSHYGLGRRSGLSHADAADVTPDAFPRLAETIHQFEANPARGSFRSWLMP